MLWDSNRSTGRMHAHAQRLNTIECPTVVLMVQWAGLRTKRGSSARRASSRDLMRGTGDHRTPKALRPDPRSDLSAALPWRPLPLQIRQKGAGSRSRRTSATYGWANAQTSDRTKGGGLSSPAAQRSSGQRTKKAPASARPKAGGAASARRATLPAALSDTIRPTPARPACRSPPGPVAHQRRGSRRGERIRADRGSKRLSERPTATDGSRHAEGASSKRV